MSNGNEPSQPVIDDCISTHNKEIFYGLTKREHFTGLAMQGILSHSFGRGNPEELAVAAVCIADALLAELDKPVTQK